MCLQKIRFVVLLLVFFSTLCGCAQVPEVPIEETDVYRPAGESFSDVLDTGIESHQEPESLIPETKLESDVCAETVTESSIESDTSLEPMALPSFVQTNLEKDDERRIILEMAKLANEYGISIAYRSGDGQYYCSVDGDKLYRSASTIKAMYCQYLLSAGVDQEQSILWNTSAVRTSASGNYTADKWGSTFSVEQLIHDTIVFSDNMAYRILFETFGIWEYNAWIMAQGIEGLCFPYAEYEFFDVSANGLSEGMMLILQDGQLLEYLEKAKFQLLSRGTSYKTASKYGYEGGTKGYHDTGIVFAPYPYVLTVMSNLDAHQKEAEQPFIRAVRLCDMLNAVLYGY